MPARSRTILLAPNLSQSIVAEVVDGTVNSIGHCAYGEQSAQRLVATKLGFNGQVRESKTGWYLLGNGYRAYNPRLMRFHSPDSWSPFGGGGLNAYMYCVGDPVNRSDPTGHFPALGLLGMAGSWAKKNIRPPGYRANTSPITLDPDVVSAALGQFHHSRMQTLSSPGTGKTTGFIEGMLSGSAPVPEWQKPWKTGMYPSDEGRGSTTGYSRTAPNPFGWPIAPLSYKQSPASRALPGSVNQGDTGKGGSGSSGMPLWNADTQAAGIGQQSSEVFVLAVGQTRRPHDTVTRGSTATSIVGAKSSSPPLAPTHLKDNRPTAAVTGTRRSDPGDEQLDAVSGYMRRLASDQTAANVRAIRRSP